MRPVVAALGAVSAAMLVAAAHPTAQAQRAATVGDGVCTLGVADRAHTPSSRCLACHDGSAARSLGASHPVEVSYLAAATSAGPTAMPPAPPAELPLVEGRVACTTCHDGRAPLPARTALAGDALCYACHRK